MLIFMTGSQGSDDKSTFGEKNLLHLMTKCSVWFRKVRHFIRRHPRWTDIQCYRPEIYVRPMSHNYVKVLLRSSRKNQLKNVRLANLETKKNEKGKICQDCKTRSGRN